MDLYSYKVILKTSTLVYHKTFNKFDPMDNKSHFYTLEPPTYTQGDRNARIIVYKIIKPIPTLFDSAAKDFMPLKYRLINVQYNTHHQEYINDLLIHIQTNGYDAIISKIELGSTALEFICNSSILKFVEEYTL